MDTGDAGRPPPDGAAADLSDLARDWITLWQSELAAAAADRELQETWQSMAALWAAAATAMVQAWPKGAADADQGSGGAGAAAAPRAAAAAAAPDPRDAEIERLRRRVDALEHRLTALDESGGAAGGAGGTG